MADKSQTLLLLKARVATLREACADKKIDPDTLTAAALLYLAMKLLKLPQADHILEHNLVDAMREILEGLESVARHALPATSVDDPNAQITLTQSQLAQLMHAKIGNA